MADVITRLKLESGEYDSKIKRATEGLLQMERECRKVNGTLASLEKDQLEYVRSLGSMKTVATSTRGKINELTQGFTELSMQYKRLTDEEKKSDYGKALSASLDQIKGRINETKQQLKDVSNELNGNTNKDFGQLGNVINSLGQKLGISGNLTEMLTSKTALMAAGITAAGAAAMKATQMWADYNKELAKQDQVTQVTTGLKGGDADRMTDQMRALSETYGVDFRDAINAANTLMTQFGKTGAEATQIIKDGMQGMIMGDGPKLLQMIQQFAPSFRDAGISADQLVAIIHNSEGGIFTDANMNAIVMGIKNLRLMLNTTSDALAKVGIDGKEMTRKLNDGTITIFDALKQVSHAMYNTGESTQAVGEVMQYVFGRQGVAAGTNLGKAIESLNLNLEETKKQTGEIGDAYAELQDANEKLNTSIREAFGYDGWEQMATGIKSKLVSALSAVIGKLGDIRRVLSGLSANQMQGDTRNGGGEAIDRMVAMLGTGKGKKAQGTYQKQIDEYQKRIFAINDQIAEAEKIAGEDMDGNVALVMQRRVRDLENRKAAIIANRNEYDRRAQALMNSDTVTDKKTGKTVTNTKTEPTKKTSAPKTEEAKNQEQINKLTEEYKKLRSEGLKADDERLTKIQAEIKKLQERNDQLKQWAQEAQGKIDIKAEIDPESLPGLEKQLKDLREAQSKAANPDVWQSYKTAIDEVTKKIAAFKGELAKPVDVSKNFSNQGISKFISDQQKSMNESGFGSAEYQAASIQITDAENIKTLLHESAQAGLDMNLELGGLYKQITEGYDVDSEWQPIIDKINEKLAEIGSDTKISLNADTGAIASDGKNIEKSWKGAMQAVGSVGSALQSIEDPAANILGIIAQAIATMALSYAQAAASPAVTSTGWGWIAFAATGIATMMSSISAIKNATGFAQGGIVPGNNMSGDNLNGAAFGINSGELILNKAQQGVLAAQLESPQGGTAGGGTPYVDGERIYLGVSNWLKRTGRGELVTSRNKR